MSAQLLDALLILMFSAGTGKVGTVDTTCSARRLLSSAQLQNLATKVAKKMLYMTCMCSNLPVCAVIYLYVQYGKNGRQNLLSEEVALLAAQLLDSVVALLIMFSVGRGRVRTATFLFIGRIG